MLDHNICGLLAEALRSNEKVVTIHVDGKTEDMTIEIYPVLVAVDDFFEDVEEFEEPEYEF